MYGVNDGFKGEQLTIFLKAFDVSSNNQIIIKWLTNFIVDVVDLSYSSESVTTKLIADSGDFYMRYKLYPKEQGCEKFI